jgi:hypothetical protein
MWRISRWRWRCMFLRNAAVLLHDYTASWSKIHNLKLRSRANLKAFTAIICHLSPPALCFLSFSHVRLQFQLLCSKRLAVSHWLLNNTDVRINEK